LTSDALRIKTSVKLKIVACEEQMEDPGKWKFDIAVIGGGIAGLYCCLHALQGRSIALFEATERIGGKVETVEMEGFTAEYGAMRFDPERQPLIGRLIQELGLETEPFPEYTSPGVELRRTRYDLTESEEHLTTLELMTLAICRILDKPGDELLAMTEAELEQVRRGWRYEGEPLWKYGLWNLFSHVLSYEALKYIIMDGSFYHFLHENPGAAAWMINWVKMLQMSKYLKGIKGGIQRITSAMLEKAERNGVGIYKRHTLKSIVPSKSKRLTLVFENGKRCESNHVILAIPPRSLRSISGLPSSLTRLLGLVLEIPLLKCFFIVKDPWWKENIPNQDIGSFPTREVHYYSRDGIGNVMVYADRPYINFWNRFVNSIQHEAAETCCNEELRLAFARSMQIDPDRIVAYGIRDWGRKPYGAACHLWKPGIEFWKVSEELEAFSLQEDATALRNVHICGEAFSDYQGFMEGALRSAENVMRRIT
jgi:monoamine oxidase